MREKEEFVGKEVKRLARQVASERIAPNAGERDKNSAFPWDEIRLLGECGLLGMISAENDGGAGVDRMTFASVVAEIGKACASTALVYVSHAVAQKAIENAATEAVKQKWLPAMVNGLMLGAFAVHEPVSGCDARAITTTARKEGDQYIVNGSKNFITSGGEADLYLVLVRTDPEKGPQGMSILLVEKDTAGLSFGRPEEKMGLKSTSSRELFFQDCPVPAGNLLGTEGGGMQVLAPSVMGWGLFGAAGIAVGIAQAAVALAVQHARQRTISGQPIGAHQAVQAHLTDMITATDAADALLLSCAAKADASPNSAAINGFKAKLFASEAAVEVTHKAIQVLGGHGYCRDYTVERLFRDARGLLLHFKTSEWLRQDIARAALGI
jgi:alkylation response protein AidB-like acyl-CoA dehydrogenase